MKISDVFIIEYPKTLIYSQMIENTLGINFISSQSRDNGVVSKVEKVENIRVYPAGIITVPLKGTVLAAHLQPEPCYVAHQIAVLLSKIKMTVNEKLFYCACIRYNAFRYTYGRQADLSLKDIELPDIIPEWVYKTDVKPITTEIKYKKLPLNYSIWKEYKIDELFYVSVSKDNNIFNSDIGIVPYVASSSDNNGVTGFVDAEPSQKANNLTIARNGSVGSVFYQPKDYCASPDDIRILTPKFKMNVYIGLFLKTIIEQEKFKYGYGRKLGTARIKNMIIKLPVTQQGTPDWDYMEQYVKSLPYSDRI